MGIVGQTPTPWEEYQRQARRRAGRLAMVRDARRIVDVQRLNMVYHDVTQIRSFIRINDRGDVTVRMSFVPPVVADFIVIKLNPFTV
jgi:hypothetical protein